MPPVITDEIAEAAARQLARRDPVLAPVIARAGVCPIRPHRDYYRELVEAIIGQQLSVKAAATILKRFLALFEQSGQAGLAADSGAGATPFPGPEQIIATPAETLRGAGLSNAKAAYVRDLAQHILDGTVQFGRFDALGNQEIIAELTAVKGIGEWTAHMFLLFCMARTDILPTGDLGVRASLQKLYGLPALPDKAQMEALARDNHWAPYTSIASWYAWQYLDNAPAKA